MSDPNHDIHLRGWAAKLTAGLMLSAIIGGLALVRQMDVRLTQLESSHIALQEVVKANRAEIDAQVARERESVRGILDSIRETNAHLHAIDLRLSRIEGKLGSAQ